MVNYSKLPIIFLLLSSAFAQAKPEEVKSAFFFRNSTKNPVVVTMTSERGVDYNQTIPAQESIELLLSPQLISSMSAKKQGKTFHPSHKVDQEWIIKARNFLQEYPGGVTELKMEDKIIGVQFSLTASEKRL